MGRPIEFDRATALDAAMHLFWRQGVRRASLADLTAAMGLSRSSFYNSFRTKQRVLEEAVDRYSAAQAAKLAEATRKASLHTALQRIFAMIARSYQQRSSA
ncbi:MAG: helix-turn-helix domain-containing protein [Casimicrobiaceae bacterium]|nr:TetR/AcrR family transcriptional regulator [Pseudomonadota bacterium]